MEVASPSGLFHPAWSEVGGGGLLSSIPNSTLNLGGTLRKCAVLESVKRVLVVDDEVDILRLVREALQALLGCEVDTTPSPEHAFELALSRRYDLLVFDFTMPGIDGATLYSLLRKTEKHCPLRGGKLAPLLLMSGNAAQRRAQELLREPGVRGLLAKPFSLERLVAVVAEIIDIPANQRVSG